MKALRSRISNWLEAKGDVRKMKASVTREAISGAYTKRKEEIESLRRYDRGEKTIDAPDIGDLCGVYKELVERGEVAFPLHDIQKQNLDAIVKTVEASYFGVIRFDSRRRRAAAYFCYLIKSHPLTDANKRLAVLWLQIYCDAYALTIDPAWTLDVLAVAIEDQEFADDALIEVAERAIFDGPAMRERFRSHSSS